MLDYTYILHATVASAISLLLGACTVLGVLHVVRDRK